MHSKQAGLFEETRGAMMLMSLFMALLLIGALYYILGVGDAVIYRRIMQDGADAGAHAASVMGAKGMNLHVLLNVVMAVTTGILLVIRSVEVMLEIILGILYGLVATLVLAAKASALIAVLSPVESTVERVGDAVEQFVRAGSRCVGCRSQSRATRVPLAGRSAGGRRDGLPGRLRSPGFRRVLSCRFLARVCPAAAEGSPSKRTMSASFVIVSPMA